MKIRFGYVSNSSSSSFIIVYNEDFFGDLSKFFKDGYFGCETYVKNNIDEFISNCFDTDEKRNEIKQTINERIQSGKKVLCLQLDSEYLSFIELFEMINQKNSNNNIEFIYKNVEN